jgi:hypothetical protein
MQSTPVPYENQLETRSCGAASLCMVYRSFGVDCTQEEIWQRIAGSGPWGLTRATTRALCADALGRGLAALIVRARDPWRALEAGSASDIRIILNHRPTTRSQEGHYTVLVGLDAEKALVHDPHAGPSQCFPRAELLELWRPNHGHSEIAGHVLVAFSKTGTVSHECAVCRSIIRDSVRCVSCRKMVSLGPSAVLGCATAACRARTWEQVFCPHCDIRMANLDDRPDDRLTIRKNTPSNSDE